MNCRDCGKEISLEAPPSAIEKYERGRGFCGWICANRYESHTQKEETRAQKHREFLASPNFLQTQEWQKLRYEILMAHGRKCMCCGITEAQGAIIQVDHIKPRSKYPELALEGANLQVLCRDCNMGKSNVHEHNFLKERD